MRKVTVIAECGSSWDRDLSRAYKLIDAVRLSGADAAKFQWTSNAAAMAARRKLGPDAEAMYRKHLQYPLDELKKLKAHCDKYSFPFMVTCYLPEDIQVIAPLVSTFKVSAFESGDVEFLSAHLIHRKHVIVSVNPEYDVLPRVRRNPYIRLLHCISKYPAKLEELELDRINLESLDGFSDHTGNPLTGAVAAGAGARIIEAHVRLTDTPENNPDYPHSLDPLQFQSYVQDIRTAEVMV